MKYLVSLFILLPVICSCHFKKETELLDSFLGSKVILYTDSMLNIKDGRNRIDDVDYTYVVYIDSTDCSECAIKSVTWWANDSDLLNALETGKLGLAFIFSPRKNVQKQIIKIIKEESVFPQYTYVDTSKLVVKYNPNIPQNRLLHTFMIDNNGKVIMAGSPITNENVKKIFLKIINKGYP